MKPIKFIGASWYNRPQVLRQCAEQVFQFLVALKQHNDALYGQWFEQGYSRSDALVRPLVVEYSAIVQAFSAGVTETSFPEFSFRVGFWNGADLDEEAIGLSFSLGGKERSRWTNNCLLELGEAQESKAYYSSEANVLALKTLFIQFWNPEKLVIEYNDGITTV